MNRLDLSYNNLTELTESDLKGLCYLNNIKYLKNLETLLIGDLKLKDEKETIELLKNMKNLKGIWCFNTFKTYTKEQLKKELININSISVY